MPQYLLIISAELLLRSQLTRTISGRMVLSQQIYSTGNTGGSSRPQVYLPKSGKEFLEQHILRKREAEVARTAFWSQTSQYFSSVARQSERFNQLTSQEVTKTSLEATNREADRERRRQNLLGRRNRLAALLEAESAALQAELELLPAGTEKPVSDLRAEREKMRKEREEVLRKEAELKMLQHWKINNPAFRNKERSLNSHTARQQLQLQIKEKKEKEEREKEEQAELDRRMEEAERRRVEESLRAEEERKEKLAELHRNLSAQMAELRQKEREMEVWRRTRAEQEELQRKVEDCQEETKRLEKVRENRELASFHKRQHRLKLRMKTKQVQEDLQADRQRLEEMARLTRLQDDCHGEKKRKAIAEVEWMKEVIQQQEEEERRREKELELMFAEEADKMWRKQEEVWGREEEARKKLMDSVVSSWREQCQERTAAARLVEDEETKRMKEIEADIRDLNQHILQQEARQQERRESLVAALDRQVEDSQRRNMRSCQEEQQELMRQRQEDIREENKLARNLTNISLSTQEEGGVNDFRRRKVRWHY